jgi:hypothetical protein
MKYKTTIKWSNKEDVNTGDSEFHLNRARLYTYLKKSKSIEGTVSIDEINFTGSIIFNTEEDAQFYIDKIKEIANTYNKTIVSTQIDTIE